MIIDVRLRDRQVHGCTVRMRYLENKQFRVRWHEAESRVNGPTCERDSGVECLSEGMRLDGKGFVLLTC